MELVPKLCPHNHSEAVEALKKMWIFHEIGRDWHRPPNESTRVRMTRCCCATVSIYCLFLVISKRQFREASATISQRQRCTKRSIQRGDAQVPWNSAEKLPSPNHYNAWEGSRRCCGERRSLPSESSSLTGCEVKGCGWFFLGLVFEDKTKFMDCRMRGTTAGNKLCKSRQSRKFLKFYGQAEEQSPESADFCF